MHIYLKKPELIGGVKAQDTVKLMLIGLVLIALVLRAFFDLNIVPFNIMDWIG